MKEQPLLLSINKLLFSPRIVSSYQLARRHAILHLQARVVNHLVHESQQKVELPAIGRW